MIATCFSAAKISQRGEHSAHVGRAEGIDFSDPEIGRHRIDDDQHYATDFLDFLPKQCQVGDKAEHALALALAHHLQDYDSIEVGTGRHEARNNRILDVIFGGEQEHIALQGAAFVTGPAISLGRAGDHVGE